MSVRRYKIRDELGNTLQFILSGGQLHDYKSVILLLLKIEIS